MDQRSGQFYFTTSAATPSGNAGRVRGRKRPAAERARQWHVHGPRRPVAGGGVGRAHGISLRENGPRVTLASHYDGRRQTARTTSSCAQTARLFHRFAGRHAEVGMWATICRSTSTSRCVFRITTSGELVLVTDDFVYPNGLCFSPMRSCLYVNCSRERLIRVYDVHPGGGVGPAACSTNIRTPIAAIRTGSSATSKATSIARARAASGPRSARQGAGAHESAGHPTNLGFGATTGGPSSLRASATRAHGTNIPGVAGW